MLKKNVRQLKYKKDMKIRIWIDDIIKHKLNINNGFYFSLFFL